MDIIKSILHVFKKSDNAFKVMHPETESACITDWNTGIVNTLASTGLSSLVNVLSSDSLLVLLIKKVFDATGVKYSIGQNGYVCFDSLVGGLIIQWVFSAQENTFNTVPLSGFTKIFETAIHKTGATATYVTSMRDTNGDSFYIASNASGTSSSGWLGLFK